MCFSLKQIAIKCPKLKRIVFPSNFILKNIEEVQQLFQILKAFPSLKRFNTVLTEETDLQNNEWFSFELFRDLPKITHLSLNLKGKTLNESVLKDIEINLPKLQWSF